MLEESKTFPAGYAKTYTFEFQTPEMNSPEFLDTTAGQMLSTALQFVSDRSTHFKWKVEARLDAKGVDLADSESISVNIRQLV
ncbi:MAG: hypothetical protein ACNS61_00455 [Candidatus Wenzhouxiangella sp. M2_3B_020]